MLGLDTITKTQQAEHGRSLPNWMSPSQSLLNRQMQRTQSPVVCDNVCQFCKAQKVGLRPCHPLFIPIPRISTQGMLEFRRKQSLLRWLKLRQRDDATVPRSSKWSCTTMTIRELRNRKKSIKQHQRHP